jgi:hypothetical protein
MNNQISWEKLLDLSYWLEGVGTKVANTPVLELNSIHYNVFVGFFVFLSVLGCFLSFSFSYLHPQNPLIPRMTFWGQNLFSMGLLGGLIWLPARQFGIGMIGARLWLLLGVTWLGFVFWRVIRYFAKFYKWEMGYFRVKVLKK